MRTAELKEPAIWELRADGEIKWQRVTFADVPLIQTETALSGINGATGERLWAMPGVVVDQDDVNDLGDALLLNVRKRRNDEQPRTLAIDARTGTVRWENEAIRGRTLSVVPLPDNRLLLVNSQRVSKSKFSPMAAGKMELRVKPELYVVEGASGQIAWKAEYPRIVDLFTGTSSFGSTQFTIEGFPQPVVVGRTLLVPWAGLTAYDVSTGRRLWATKYSTTVSRTKDRYHVNTMAISDGVAYTSAVGVVRAIDLTTGKARWTAKGFGNAVPQLFVEDDRVYAKLGGMLYHAGKSEFVGIGKNGLVALERQTGRVLWKYTKVDDQTSNAVRWRHGFVLADDKAIYGVGLDGRELFRWPVRFDSDSPYVAQLGSDDTVELRGEEHRAAFRLRDGSQVYALAFPKPDVPPWKTMAAIGIRVTTRVAVGMLIPYFGQYLVDPADRAVSVVTAGLRQVPKPGPAAAADTAAYDFFFSTIDGDGAATRVVRVERASGQSRPLVTFDHRRTTPEIDPLHGRMYTVEKEMLVAYPLFDRPQ
jgi:outer membrane protein assembly factor BamB